MKFSHKFSFLCILFFFFALPGIAQTNSLSVKDLSTIHIDDISDAEIKTYFAKATENGISEQNIYQLLLERGLPQMEIDKLEQRLAKLNSGITTGTDKNSKLTPAEISNPTDNKSRYSNPDTNLIPTEIHKGDKSIFGSELFMSDNIVFEPNVKIATPSGYVLGPDDELVINVFGFSEKSYNLTVNQEGYIYIQNVGPIYVSGLSIEEAGEKIKSKLASTVYRAIRTGQTRVQISLGKIRSIRVMVIGAAKKPGTFTVSSLTTLFNILYLCGGPSDLGSYRKIELIRGNDVKRIADLYAFLLEGTKKDNIILKDGDVVRIPYYNIRVAISGQVKREGKFEMLENEMFNDLLHFSGGLNDEAYKASISVTRITDKEKRQIDLDAAQFSSFKLKGSDSFVVGKLINRFENRIYITGAIFRPGPYELSPGLTLRDLLKKAGGVREDAYTARINVYRRKNDLTPSMVALGLDSILNNQVDLALIKNDSVVIHSIFEFRDNFSVEIKGQVKKPGMFQWRESLTLRDLLLSAGGSTDFGDSATIEISRRLKNADVSKLNQEQTKIFTIDLLNANDPTRDILLQPYDVVIVKSLPGYMSQRTVLVQGEIMSPGQYTLNKSGDRLSDLFKRVGGFKASADSTFVTIRRYTQSNLSVIERENVFKRLLNLDNDSLTTNTRLKNEIYKTYDMISINLANALSQPESPENLRLEDGDLILVQRNTNLVKVSGEVYYPTIVPYKLGASLNYYLEMAGNYTDNARKSKTVVIYPDGKVKPMSRFLFFKNYPTVVPGSEVYVPQRKPSNRARLSIGELSLIVSAIAIIANVIIFANK